MPSISADLNARVTTLSAVLTSKRDRQLVATALQAANGNWSIALDQLKGKLKPASLQKATLAHSLAELTGDNVGVVATLVAQPGVKNLRDVALNFNPAKLAAIVPPQDIPSDIPGDTPTEKAKNYASELRKSDRGCAYAELFVGSAALLTLRACSPLRQLPLPV
jgi:hypothetical protein